MDNWALLFIGLAFFVFVMQFVKNSEKESYDRTLNERREFGYQEADRPSRSKRK